MNEDTVNRNLLDFGFLKHPFYWAASEGLMDVCKLFIKNLKEKNPANYGGYSLLHWAASNGHLEICRCIIENGGLNQLMFLTLFRVWPHVTAN